MSLKPILLCSLAVVSIAAAPGRPDRHFDAESVEYFEKKVRPLLVNNCNICHSAETNSKGGLRVDDRNGLIQGGNRGPAVVPGDPENSILIQAVLQSEDVLKMPPKKRLSAEEIAVLTKWVKDGAAWTEVDASIVTGNPNPRYEKLKKEHWAWQPLKDAKPPASAGRVVAAFGHRPVCAGKAGRLGTQSGSRRGQARLDSSSHL